MDFVDQHVAQLLFTTAGSAFMIMGPSLRTKEFSLGIACKEGIHLNKQGKSILASLLANLVRSLIYEQCRWETMTNNQMRTRWTGMASKGCDVGRRDLTIIKTRLKGKDLNHMCIDKGVTTVLMRFLGN